MELQNFTPDSDTDKASNNMGINKSVRPVLLSKFTQKIGQLLY